MLEKNKRTVFQKDADKLNATTTPDPTSITIVEQSDPSKLKSTVTQFEKDRTVTGVVGINDALNTRINPAKEDGNLASIKTNTDNIPASPSTEDGNLASILTQLDITLSALRDALRGASTKDFSTLESDVESIKDTDGIKKITDTVTVIGEVDFPSGSGSNGNVTLTNADTTYAVPSAAPAKNYVIVIYNGSDTDMYWGYENSNSNGILLPVGGKVTLRIGTNNTIYAYCGSAGKVITYTYKEMT